MQVKLIFLQEVSKEQGCGAGCLRDDYHFLPLHSEEKQKKWPAASQMTCSVFGCPEDSSRRP